MSVPTVGKSSSALVVQPGPGGQAKSTGAPETLKSVSQPSPQPSQADIQKAFQAIKEKLSSLTSDNLQFSVDNSSGEVVARITDSQTGALIRQIPSKEALAIAEELDRLRGLLVQQQA
jgi:flagellar protein FlaG